jgi:hypothetical protein
VAPTAQSLVQVAPKAIKAFKGLQAQVALTARCLVPKEFKELLVQVVPTAQCLVPKVLVDRKEFKDHKVWSALKAPKALKALVDRKALKVYKF